MVEIKSLVDKLISDGDENSSKHIKEAAPVVVRQILEHEILMIDLVKELNPVLTNGNHNIRLKGVEMLTLVITALPTGLLATKEIEVLAEFLRLRLVDHNSMEQLSLQCLSFFVDCENKPSNFNKDLMDFLKDNVNKRKLDAKTKLSIYQLLWKMVLEKRRLGTTLQSDMIYTIIHFFEDESNPENLMLCFKTVSYLLKNFQDLEPFIDEIFEWLTSYYPIDYTPDKTNGSTEKNVTRSDLVGALYDCFYATPLNADNLQTLLLEKLESNVVATQIESLECLVKCYELFPLSRIKSYVSTFWTAIRMECLKKKGQVDSNILEASYRALSALSKKLCEDPEQYFVLVSDMYEELSIAFRKPEMELFEPAAKLLTHAALPDFKGFNYILRHMIPISRNAIENSETRPVAGLSYVFEKLSLHHPTAKLDEGTLKQLNELVLKVADLIDDSPGALEFLQALVSCKIELSEDTLNNLVNKLFTTMQSSLDASSTTRDNCLALISVNYNRYDILLDEEEAKNCQSLTLETLVKYVDCYKSLNCSAPSTLPILKKFQIYLKLMVKKLDIIDTAELNSSLDSTKVDAYLTSLRSLALSIKTDRNIVQKIGEIHAMIINKLSNENLNPVLVSFFQSDYCQKLVPVNQTAGEVLNTSEVYLPIIRFILKSIVVRNHSTSIALVNLTLNFITSDKVRLGLALSGAKTFCFVQDDHSSSAFTKDNHYQVFPLYKQKFYMQTMKEAKIRYEKLEGDTMKRALVLTSIAIQLSHLFVSIYKRDSEWLLRELLRTLAPKGGDCNMTNSNQSSDELIDLLYESIECLIENTNEESISSFLPTLVDLSLSYTQNSRSMQVRKRALFCLTKLAKTADTSNLLTLRSTVIEKLRPILEDKKRLVRQAAAEARLRWVLVGQPIG